MNSSLKNFLLFIAVLVLSYLTAPYFGGWYNKIDYQGDSAFWGPTASEAMSLAGFIMGYAFFIPLLFKSFGYGNKNKIVFWLTIPLILFFAAYSLQLVYIPIIVSLIGFGLATLINKIFKTKL